MRFLAILLLTSLAAPGLASVLGVPPQDLARYSGDIFTCKDNSATFSKDHINDDYCDCPDGSDEPGTSACSNGKFYCQNKGHVGLTLTSSFVGDGICDCCDGSDETGGKCKNTCLSERKKTLKADFEILERQEKGLEEKKRYIQVAIELKQEYSEKLESLRKELNDKSGEVAQLEGKKSTEEAVEKVERDRLEVERQERLALKAAEQPETTEEDQTQNQENSEEQEGASVGGADGAQEVDATKEKPEENKVLDGDEPENFPYPKEYAFKKEGEEDKKEEEEEENFPYPQEYAFKKEDEEETDDGKAQKEEGGKDEDSYEESNNEIQAEDDDADEVSYTRKEAEDIRRALKAAENVQKRVRKELTELEDQLKADYGKDDAFMSLLGQCFEARIQQYTYKACPYESANQGSTSLGKFSEFKTSETGELSMLFENGQKCWNGPARSLQLDFVCGSDITLSKIEEPSKCFYRGQLTTPAACDEEYAKDLRDSLKSIMEDIRLEKEAKTHSDL